MARLPEHEPVLQAAERFVEACLRHDDSLFTRGKAIWTLQSIKDFHQRFVEGADFTPDVSFGEKLKRQLEGASDDTLQYTSELLFVHLLSVRDMSADAKKGLITTPLSSHNNPPPIPTGLSSALEIGLARFGTAHIHRYFHLVFLTVFLLNWKQLDQPTQSELLTSPGRFRNWLETIPSHSAAIQREALSYLIFPDEFEPMVSLAHKREIAKRFSYVISDHDLDLDQQLKQIRAALTDEFGEAFSFYDPLIRPAWDPNANQWDKFIFWAAKFYRRKGFEDDELSYKRNGARQMRVARDMLLSGSENWIRELRRAFQPPMNLTAWQVYDPFLKWCDSSPDQASTLLSVLWTDGKFESRLRSFLDQLPNDIVSGPSARIGLTSHLLFADDVSLYPFFRIRVYEAGFRVTGYPTPPKEVHDADRYLHAIRFTDQIINEAKNRGLSLRDRLDGQSVLWTVVAKPRKELDGWPTTEVDELERFRAGLPRKLKTNLRTTRKRSKSMVQTEENSHLKRLQMNCSSTFVP